MHKIVFVFLFVFLFFFFFILVLKKLQIQKAGKSLLVILAKKKGFTNFLQFLVAQSLSQMKSLENIFFLSLLSIRCTSK